MLAGEWRVGCANSSTAAGEPVTFGALMHGALIDEENGREPLLPKRKAVSYQVPGARPAMRRILRGAAIQMAMAERKQQAMISRKASW